ncbi:MAG: large subunit ribosomal protein L24 [Parcubacteria group bacterium Gr01-1014_66]|nr:MAG: large subunit ribosomal protein L24 [Parcubacteria group bacterium Gr01-1014_66]
MKIRKGDQILVRAGNERGTHGKVLSVFPDMERIVVEGVNMRKKHMRARTGGRKGEIVSRPSAFPVSRVMLICPSCSKPTRVGLRREGEKKERWCKQCGKRIS